MSLLKDERAPAHTGFLDAAKRLKQQAEARKREIAQHDMPKIIARAKRASSLQDRLAVVAEVNQLQKEDADLRDQLNEIDKTLKSRVTFPDLKKDM